jgi:hypothetical protein
MATRNSVKFKERGGGVSASHLFQICRVHTVHIHTQKRHISTFNTPLSLWWFVGVMSRPTTQTHPPYLLRLLPSLYIYLSTPLSSYPPSQLSVERLCSYHTDTRHNPKEEGGLNRGSEECTSSKYKHCIIVLVLGFGQKLKNRGGCTSRGRGILRKKSGR